MRKPLTSPKLSIIILTYNSQDQLPACLESIYRFNRQSLQSKNWELIVIDNASGDKTIANLQKSLARFPNLQIIENRQNLGFGPANNLAANKSLGEYVLFLNPDTEVEKGAISDPLKYLENHHNDGVITAKLLLGNGQLDATCHRGFPTPWNAFCYFSGLNGLFPDSHLFAGYTLGYLDLNTIHEIDAVTGAYLMISRNLGEKLNWFDPDFFWKGEDLDLCYRVKELGYKIIFYPQAIVHHYKGSSKGHKRGSRSLQARFEVMRQFYFKHYSDKYPSWIRSLVFAGIKVREFGAELGL